METKNQIDSSQDIKKETQEPRMCPRCKGTKFDPFYQSYCYRCGGIGEVYGSESNFKPSSFAD